MPNYDSFEAQILTEGMTQEQKMLFHREMSDAWRDPDKAKSLRFWLGGIGAHHRYLGDKSRANLSLLFCWTGIPVLKTLFEGDIKKRTQQVNSQIAQDIAARIRGIQFQKPGAAFPGATPAYQQASPMSAPMNHQVPIAPNPSPQFQPQASYATTERTAQSMPHSPNMKRWALILGGGVIALLVVSATIGAFASKAKDVAVGDRPAVTVPSSGIKAEEGGTPATTTKGTTPDIQVYIAPDAESLVKAAGLTEDAIKEAVRQGLTQRRIVSIPDNAVVEGLEDWASVRITLDPREDGSQLVIELSVRNGASANFQLIRWQTTNGIEGVGDPKDIPTTLAKQMDSLQAAFNSSEYKRGQPANNAESSPTAQ